MIDKKDQDVTFILDFEKAFDTPSHVFLKSKLFKYGIGGTTLIWINVVGSGMWLLFRSFFDRNIIEIIS